jgi:hypothetical protein
VAGERQKKPEGEWSSVARSARFSQPVSSQSVSQVTSTYHLKVKERREKRRPVEVDEEVERA